MTDQPQDPPPPYGQQPTPWQPPAYQGAPPPAHPSYAPPPKSGTNGFAIAALVFGIIGGCLLSIIFGIVALNQIKKSGQGGRGMAIAGIVLGAVWAVALAIGVAVGGLGEAERDGDGAISKPGKVESTELKVGDCIKVLPDDGKILDVPAVPCADSHEGQVFAQLRYENDTYPGDKAVADLAEKRCSDAMEAKAPKAYQDDSVGLFVIYPLELSWAQGDRVLTCLAATEEATTGSVLD